MLPELQKPFLPSTSERKEAAIILRLGWQGGSLNGARSYRLLSEFMMFHGLLIEFELLLLLGVIVQEYEQARLPIP